MLNAKVCTTWKSLISKPLCNADEPAAASDPPTTTTASALLTSHIVAAIHAFFRSISLQPVGDNSLQDILRILALWFEFGAETTEKDGERRSPYMESPSSPYPTATSASIAPPSISAAMLQGFQLIALDNWLAVIPQLLARIHVPVARIRDMLLDLLARVGKQHPQALVYPLTFASKSPLDSRRSTALSILATLSSHSPLLINQGSMVSTELVRVAILWHELYHEALEESSRLWFGCNDFNGMRKILEPLHIMIAHPASNAEYAFVATYGKELDEAYEYLKRYTKTINEIVCKFPKRRELNLGGSVKYNRREEVSKQATSIIANAWDIYTRIFRRLTKEILNTTELLLADISPRLLLCRDLELAVPGTYRSNSLIIQIGSFSTQLKIIESKQHPRRISMLGYDGIEYPFLLKGHEDMRQDERIMQLFSLVNTLLLADHTTAKIDLRIRRYAVIPISPNSGLIEWVPFCDPMHTVIKRYRDARKIPLNIEQKTMLKYAPDYAKTTIMQKIEVFTHALSCTSGGDLAKVMWLHAPNAETWLDRRTAFTHSTAVMSMVGYLIGLGDRHTCNLLLDRHSGKLVHIDFGDLFEVSRHREKWPEKVPFRLTRMMVHAWEVAGIEGSFRHTCENVMRVLRKVRGGGEGGERRVRG
jgi:FKBP12-rapamycin complex-associated protein